MKLQKLFTNQHGVMSQNSRIFMNTLLDPQISPRTLSVYLELGLVLLLKQKRKTARRSFKY